MAEVAMSEVGISEVGMPEVGISEVGILEVDRFLPECRLCQFYTCNVHLRCAVHPSGVEADQCLDFTPYQPSSQPPAIEVYPVQKFKHAGKKTA